MKEIMSVINDVRWCTWLILLVLVFIANYLGHIVKSLGQIARVLGKMNKQDIDEDL